MSRALRLILRARRAAFLSAAFCAMAAAGQAPDAEPAASLPAHRPRLVCTNAVFNFGRVENNNDVVHNFVLRNEGDLSLLIGNIRTDCGCTAVRVRDTTIRPGAETVVEGRLSLKGRNGAQRKRILVESNDPENPVTALFFEGEAYSEIEVKPDRLHLGCFILNSMDVFYVNLVSNGGMLYDVLFVDVTSPYFAAYSSNMGRGRHRITIESQPPFRPGRIDATLMIWTDNPARPRIDVPIQGRAVADLYMVPEEVLISASESNSVSRLAALRSIRGRPFKIVKVIPPSDAVQVRVRALGEYAYRLELRCVPGPGIDGSEVRVVTDQADGGDVVLPIRLVKQADAKAGTPFVPSKPEP